MAAIEPSAMTLMLSPVLTYSTGAIVATATIAWVIRMLRRDLRDANLDKAYDTHLELLQTDLKALRERLDDNERKYASLHAEFIMLQRENKSLKAENEKLREESKSAHAEILTLQVQTSHQLATIEDLQSKVRNLEAANTIAAKLGGRRKEDDS